MTLNNDRVRFFKSFRKNAIEKVSLGWIWRPPSKMHLENFGDHKIYACDLDYQIWRSTYNSTGMKEVRNRGKEAEGL